MLMKLDSPDETLAQAICIRRELCVVDRRVEGSMGCYEKQSLQGVLETPDGTRLAAEGTIGGNVAIRIALARTVSVRRSNQPFRVS